MIYCHHGEQWGNCDWCLDELSALYAVQDACRALAEALRYVVWGMAYEGAVDRTMVTPLVDRVDQLEDQYRETDDADEERRIMRELKAIQRWCTGGAAQCLADQARPPGAKAPWEET